MKQFVILAHGSRGDVQPYVALGWGLKQAGYAVNVAAPAQFSSLVQEHGLGFSPLAGDPKALMAQAVEKANRSSHWLLSAQVVLKYAAPIALQVLQDVEKACQDADVIIHSLLLTQAGHQAALKLGAPDFSALVFAVFNPTRAFPNPGFPELKSGLYNRLTHHLFTQLFWRGGNLAYQRIIRSKHPEAPPHLTWPFQKSNPRPTPILYGFSPRVIPKPPEWGDHAHVTGYWHLPRADGWRAPAGLVDFLAQGPAPVFIGFGSVISRQAQHLAGLVVEALSQTGQRGILLSGWGGFSPRSLPKEFYLLDEVPFDWLFPQLRAAVIHGGIGTVASALRAGLPTMVIPFTADQFFWSSRLYGLGVSPKPIPHRRLTVENLVSAFRKLLGDGSISLRAGELGQSLRSEDGVAEAIRILERYLEV